MSREKITLCKFIPMPLSPRLQYARNMGAIRERLRQLIESKKDEGVTQASLARKMGCVSSQVNHLLSGERELSEKWIIKFCDALGVTLSDLDWKKKDLAPKEAADSDIHRKLQTILDANADYAAGIRLSVEAIHQYVIQASSASASGMAKHVTAGRGDKIEVTRK